jgi:hypothetical protein
LQARGGARITVGKRETKGIFVNSPLSISAAWDRTKARFSADGGLLLTVALALIALPSALAEFAFPSSSNPFGAVASAGEMVTVIVVLLLGIVGQLALVKLTLGRSVSVGEAILHGARRMPVFLAAAVILLLILFVLAIPFGMLLAAMGVAMSPGAAPTDGRGLLIVAVFFGLVLFLGTRLLVSSPVASMEPVGPIAILKRSWKLTSGNFWRLFAFIWLFLIAAMVVLIAAASLTHLIVGQLFGAVEPFTAGALIIALVVSLVTSGITAMFVVMVSEIYAQLAAPDPAQVSVPNSGT